MSMYEPTYESFCDLLNSSFNLYTALACVAHLVGHCPRHQEVTGLIPDLGTCCRLHPWGAGMGESHKGVS